MRAALISAGSIFLTGSVIGNAFYHKKQFYPSVVYITKSNPSMIVIYLQCLILFLLLGKLMRRIFFGTLRAAELEHLIERGWYAVTETCLTFTVFRDDLNSRFVAIFAVLLFLKCFHWLVEDRVDFMERSPNVVVLFHVRIVSLLTVLASCDITFIYLSYYNTVTRDSGYQLIFGFEYAILLASILNIVIKYILHWIDVASDSPWDEKAAYLLYLELVMSFIKLLLYSAFIMQMLRFYSFPLFVLRPIYLGLRTFKKACNDVVMSRRAIYNMNHLYPTVTREELDATDNVCIICREEMSAELSVSKRLPCNHIFHVTCLRSWFQRQQTCPTCRMDVLRHPNMPSNQAPRPNQAPGRPQGQQRVIQDHEQQMQALAQMFVQAMITQLTQILQQQQQLQLQQQQLQLQLLQQQQQQQQQQQIQSPSQPQQQSQPQEQEQSPSQPQPQPTKQQTQPQLQLQLQPQPQPQDQPQPQQPQAQPQQTPPQPQQDQQQQQQQRPQQPSPD